MDLLVNYWSVLAAAVASFILGMLWYSPLLFGKIWMKLAGISQQSMKGKGLTPPVAMFLGFLANLVVAYVLAHFLNLFGATTWQSGFELAFWAWLGFTTVTQLGSFLWEGKPFSLFLLNTTYSLANLMLMSAVITLWPSNPYVQI